jgi:hypothetical protein
MTVPLIRPAVVGTDGDSPARAIVGQRPIDTAGWIKLQSWERGRAPGHGIGIVVARIGAMIGSVPTV